LTKSSTRPLIRALVYGRVLFSVSYIYNTAVMIKQQKGATR